MSNHLLAFHDLESQRVALIARFVNGIEDLIDRLVSERVAEELRQRTGSVHNARTYVAPVRREPSPAARPVAMLPAMPSRAPTVIPENVPITRLPPGPSPHEKKRSGPPMNCRCPGCLIKSRGPRYEYFCEEHYRILSADERRHYAAMWREARAAKHS